VEVLYFMVPLAVALVGLVVVALVWAVRSGQFEDLEGPAHRILMDGDGELERPPGAEAPGSHPAARGRDDGGAREGDLSSGPPIG
jgi:cbb3-type cytochrome oxidase maturation protein